MSFHSASDGRCEHRMKIDFEHHSRASVFKAMQVKTDEFSSLSERGLIDPTKRKLLFEVRVVPRVNHVLKIYGFSGLFCCNFLGKEIIMNYKSNYNIYLPNYSIGTQCYDQIRHVTRYYGNTAVVIGGKTAMEKSRTALLNAIRNTNLEIIDFLWYGGNSTYENGDALIAHPSVQKADMIFAVGGGRACDAVKYIADKLDKPLFTFPTIGSNCAPVTAVSVMYHPDGSFRDYYYPKLANHCFIHSQIIAEAPVEYLWAGIGDALSKEVEVEFAARHRNLSHTPLMGRQMCHICTDPLVEFGKKGLNDCKNNQPSFEMEQLILDIIVSTGVVSNLVTTADEDYYNSSLAHCVYYGSTLTKKGHAHLHGEVVSLGVLCLLEFDQQEEEFERIMQFNHSIGLPICFDDVEITEDEFEIIADRSLQTIEWENRPPSVTRKGFIQAMKNTNAKGRAYKFAKTK